jgi:hypothetical protein
MSISDINDLSRKAPFGGTHQTSQKSQSRGFAERLDRNEMANREIVSVKFRLNFKLLKLPLCGVTRIETLLTNTHVCVSNS